jgi:hypothetical protein
MKLVTCLVNSTKKEYIIIGCDYPTKTGAYLGELEKHAKWDLIFDDIYIKFSTTPETYKDVKSLIYTISGTGGEIINEFL